MLVKRKSLFIGIAIVTLIGVFVFSAGKLTQRIGIEDNKNTCTFDSQTVKMPSDSSKNVFANSLTEIDKIDRITPGSQTGDSRFAYLWIKGDNEVPIFAPSDGTLVKIAYKNRVDVGPGMSKPDYDLTFLVDCQTIYQINHVTNPVPDIVALKPNNDPYQIKPGLPLGENDTKPLKNIAVKAGQKLGTTSGSPNAHNFDFGLFINGAAVCPFERFDSTLRSKWLDLFGGNKCEVSGNY